MKQSISLVLNREPFSSFGSYLSIAHQDKSPMGWDMKSPWGSGYYLRSHHSRGVIQKEIFVLDLQMGNQNFPGEWSATPADLQVKGPEESSVEIHYTKDGNLRLRGKGVSLRLRTPPGAFGVPYQTADDEVCMNARYTCRRYQFQMLQGNVQFTELVEEGDFVERGAHAELTLNPDQSGVWDCCLDEFWSTWVRPDTRPSFNDSQLESQTRFENFRDSHTHPRNKSRLDAWERAIYVNWASTVQPEGLLQRPSMLMSKWWMDQVWSWDHCFNAMALAGSHDELAWDQWNIPFDHQDEFGAIPDGMNDVFKHYNFCKPPVHGWSLLEMMKHSKSPISKENLSIAYDRLSKHTNWFLTHRVLPGETLPYYLHGNDSGWDNSTMFSEGVPLSSPDLPALLVKQMDALQELALKIGKADEAQQWKGKANTLFQTMVEQMWTGQAFQPWRTKNGTEKIPVQCESMIPNLPIILGQRLPKEIQNQLAENLERFVTPFGVATEHPDSKEYTPDGYWKGPVWGPSTHLVVTGLRDCGFNELAKTIAEGYCCACEQSGFAENFNALTGESLRDPAYTWTSSVYLLLVDWLESLEG